MPNSYSLDAFVKSIGVAARRDYVFSNVSNLLAAGEDLSTSVSIDPKLPWVWFGFRVASMTNTDLITDVRIQLQDAEQRFLFTDPVLLASIGTNDFGWDPYTISPMRILPPGGAIYLQLFNSNERTDIGLEILFMGYEVSATENPSGVLPGRNHQW